MLRMAVNWKRLQRQVLLLTLMTSCAHAYAANWDIVPRLLLSERYSDNITLSSTAQENDLVTEITPGISVRGTGARLTTNIDYNYQKLLYNNSSKRNANNVQFQGDIAAELLKKIFFIDINSSVSQQQQNNRASQSGSNTAATGNRSQVINYEVSPYVVHHLGRYADMEFRLSKNEVFNDAETSSVSNSKRNNTSFHIESGRYFGRSSWRLDFDRRKIESDSGSDSEFKTLEGQLSYALNRDYQITGTYGIEKNDFASIRDAQDGPYWTVGAIWTPSRRTNVEGRIGRRYYGKTFFLTAMHQHRRFLFTANYSEDPQTLNDIQSGQQLIALTDTLGQPIFDPNDSSNIDLATNLPSLQRDAVLINKSFNATLEYEYQRTNVDVTYSFDVRDYQDTAEDRGDEVQTLDISINHQMSRVMNAGANLGITSSQFDAGLTEDQRISLGLFLTRQLGQNVDAQIRYQYTKRESDISTSEYTENSLSVNLSMHY